MNQIAKYCEDEIHRFSKVKPISEVDARELLCIIGTFADVLKKVREVENEAL